MSHGQRLYADESFASREAPFPLLSAAEAGDATTVTSLLADGADINLRSPEGWSPLIMAAKEGHTELLAELLKAGAAVNPPDVSHTALRGAAIFGRETCVRALLEAAADPNALSAGGKTPLMGAVMNNHAETVRILLKAGARLDLTNEFGETAAALAEAKGHTACLAALQET